MMERIDDPVRTPTFLQRRQFACQTRGADRIAIQTTRYGFMMEQPGTRLVERLPATLIETQAQVHIVEGDREIGFVQPAHRFEPRPLDDQTGRRHRGNELGHCVSAKIAVVVGVQQAMGVSGPPPMPRTTPACWMRPSG